MATTAPPIKASWYKIASHDVLKRSSHSVASIGDEVYIFGGELLPRQPRDGNIHVLSSTGNDNEPQTLQTPPDETPTPRVGASLTSLKGTLYAFGGRGGSSMTALSENGSFWTFDTRTKTWSPLKPSDLSAPFPSPRSYHAATTDGENTIYIHAGCPASGRLRDFWAFDVSQRTWTELPAAPGVERGGTSLCFAAGRIWRMGGFDGKEEVGGVLDSYDVEKEVWESWEFEADGVQGPGRRSVAALLALKVGGRLYLVTGAGEADPSVLGHEGAGKMLGDWWGWDIEGREWRRVEVGGERPEPRGWFGGAVVGEEGEGERVVVVGGLGGDNERIEDAWELRFE